MNCFSRYCSLLILSLVFLLASCQKESIEIEPVITYNFPIGQLECLPCPFTPLSDQECRLSWGKELLLGDNFAKEMDLYRAITCYKRALYIIPYEYVQRRMQIEYGIIKSYYLGQKYLEAAVFFEKSSLLDIPNSFPVIDELLIILYECFQKSDQQEKADRILNLIRTRDPCNADKLALSNAIIQADFATISSYAEQGDPSLDNFLLTYDINHKSIFKAKAYNAILPGAGYLYVGQKQTAITSFLINALFVAAAYHFFAERNYAAGLIVTSLETGWYLGGINGAGLAAKEYNERLYEKTARDVLIQNRLFPVLMLNCSF